MAKVKVVEFASETPVIEQVYDRGCAVLLEHLGKLRGVIDTATLQPTLQVIDVTGRLVHSLYPIIENIHDEEKDITLPTRKSGVGITSGESE